MKKITKSKLASLKKKSIKLRLRIIEYTELKSSFLGSCFSCLDLIIYLYNHFLKINKKNILEKKKRLIYSQQRSCGTIIICGAGRFKNYQ